MKKLFFCDRTLDEDSYVSKANKARTLIVMPVIYGIIFAVVILLWFATEGRSGNLILDIVFLVFIGVMIIWGAHNTLHHATLHLAIDKNGITKKSLLRKEKNIPWQAVTEIQKSAIGKRKYISICIEGKKPMKFMFDDKLAALLKKLHSDSV